MISQETRTDLIRLAVLWVVFSLIAEAAAVYFTDGYPGMASRQGEVTAEAVFFLLWLSIPVFVLIVLIIAYSMIRFRVSDDDREPSTHQYQSGLVFPWTWVVGSILLNTLFIFHPGITGLNALWSMAAAATDPLEIEVNASQWEWSYNYPAQGLSEQGELVVPVDTPIRFVLRTDDVMHSFWVPAWGIKRAIIPGQTDVLVITPEQISDTTSDPLTRVQCSQICGAGHADMQSAVRVVAEADFDAWVEARGEAGHDEMEGMDMGGMDMSGEDDGHGAEESGHDETEGMDMGDMDMDMDGDDGHDADATDAGEQMQMDPDEPPMETDEPMDMPSDSETPAASAN